MHPGLNVVWCLMKGKRRERSHQKTHEQSRAASMLFVRFISCRATPYSRGEDGMNWRSKKLTQSARNESCVSCGSDDGTIVWAHSNEQLHGKGMGIKSHDLFGAYLCHKCHERYDHIKGFEYKGARLDWFREQWEKSMIIACKKGYL